MKDRFFKSERLVGNLKPNLHQIDEITGSKVLITVSNVQSCELFKTRNGHKTLRNSHER